MALYNPYNKISIVNTFEDLKEFLLNLISYFFKEALNIYLLLEKGRRMNIIFLEKI